MIDLPESLLTVRLAPLFTIDLSIGAVQRIGTGGEATVVGVIGVGRFAGERLRGRILEGGSDWQRVVADGTAHLDCRLVLETDDGALIAMTYGGIRHGSPEVLKRLAQGEEVDPGSYYLRIAPRFETSAPAYAWLNQVVAIGTGHRPPAGPIYNVFEVL